jgi:hypothetical protein
MFEFKHPKYYTELRKRNKSDQVISGANATAKVERAPGPGHKPQASTKLVNACIDQREPQAPSSKQQAPSAKLQKKI